MILILAKSFLSLMINALSMQDTRTPLQRGLRRVRKRLGLPVGPSHRDRVMPASTGTTKQEASPIISMPPTPIASAQEYNVSEAGSSQRHLGSHNHHPPTLPSEEQVRAIGMETVALTQDSSIMSRSNFTTTPSSLQDATSLAQEHASAADGVPPATPFKKQPESIAAPLTPDNPQRKLDTPPTPQLSLDALPEAGLTHSNQEDKAALKDEHAPYISAGLTSEEPPTFAPVVEEPEPLPPTQSIAAPQSPRTTSTTSCAGSTTEGRASEATLLLEQLQAVLKECRALHDHRRARAERYAAKLHRGGSVEKLQRRRNKMEHLAARVHVTEEELQELERYVENTAHQLRQENAAL